LQKLLYLIKNIEDLSKHKVTQLVTLKWSVSCRYSLSFILALSIWTAAGEINGRL